MTPDSALQSTVIPLRGLPAAELRRYTEKSMFVCIPDAIPQDQREAHFKLARRLFGDRAILQEDIFNGYSIRFRSDAYDELVQFVGNERRCCPAIQFEILVSPEDGPITLQMSGPDGAREFIRSELPLK